MRLHGEKIMNKIIFSLALFLTAAEASALRVVSLMPSYTEIVFELGAGAELAGVSSYCNWPVEAEKLEKVGDYYRPDMEKIYALKPDLVLAGKWENSPVAENLRQLGFKVVVIPAEKKVEDIYKTVRIIAENLGKKKEGEKLVKRMKKELAAFKGKKVRKKIFLEADAGLWTVGKGSFMNDVIKKAGGENVFSGTDRDYFRVSWEAVLEKNPDVIITLSSSPEDLAKMPLADKIAAIKEGRVFRFEKEDRDAFARPSPRIIPIIGKLEKIVNSK